MGRMTGESSLTRWLARPMRMVIFRDEVKKLRKMRSMRT